MEEKNRVLRNAAYVDDGLLERMRTLATGRTDEALNAQFGISYNTWRKLMAGQPIRPSLASRLTDRLRSLQATEDADLANEP